MDDSKFFPDLAQQVIAGLQRARGDESAEEAVLKKLVKDYTAAARQAGEAGELMIPERFCEDEYEHHFSVIETAAGDSEDDEFRWREMQADICGY